MFHFHRERVHNSLTAALSGYLLSCSDNAGDPTERSWFAIEGKQLNWYTSADMAHRMGHLQLATLHRIDRLHTGSNRYKRVHLSTCIV